MITRNPSLLASHGEKYLAATQPRRALSEAPITLGVAQSAGTREGAEFANA